MQNAINSLGGLGAKQGKITVGACAEFNVANPILKLNPTMKPGAIPMSNAYRPSTGKTIDPCPVCLRLFGQ
jgi:hypothetical protein